MPILDAIQAERERQISMNWPDNWSPAEWAALIAHYATRRVHGDLSKLDRAAIRADMVKVAALAIACIESI